MLFKNLSLIVWAIGMLFSLLFHLGTRETKAGAGEDEEGGKEGEQTPLLTRSTLSSPSVALQWRHWLREPSFYQVNAVGQSASWVFKRLWRCQPISFQHSAAVTHDLQRKVISERFNSAALYSTLYWTLVWLRRARFSVRLEGHVTFKLGLTG